MVLRTKFLAVLALSTVSSLFCLVALLVQPFYHDPSHTDLFSSRVLSLFREGSTPSDDIDKMLHIESITIMSVKANESIGQDIFQRQTLLKRFCVNERQRRAINSRGMLRHIIMSHKLGFAYCEVGKVASTTWRTVLRLALGDDGDLTLRESDHFRPLRRLTPAVSKYFKFIFVRHPFDRLVSAFYEKFHYHRTEYWQRLAPKIIRKYRINMKHLSTSAGHQRGFSTGHNVSFDEFVRYLVDPRNSDPLTDFHWSPQSSMCQLCRVKYNFIGHYETIFRDADYVLKRLGVSDRIRFPRPKSFTTASVNAHNQHRSGSTEGTSTTGRTVEHLRKMFSELSPETIRKLKEFYRHDFKIFGYDPDVYL